MFPYQYPVQSNASIPNYPLIAGSFPKPTPITNNIMPQPFVNGSRGFSQLPLAVDSYVSQNPTEIVKICYVPVIINQSGGGYSQFIQPNQGNANNNPPMFGIDNNLNYSSKDNVLDEIHTESPDYQPNYESKNRFSDVWKDKKPLESRF